MFLILLCTKSLLCFGTWVENKNITSDTTRKVNIFPLPLVYYTPETRLSVGGGANFTFKIKNDSLTRPSQVFTGFAVTQNRQLLTYAQYNLFTYRNRYFIRGELGYYKFSYYFWGIGSKANQEEFFEVNFPRIQFFGLYRFKPHAYFGPTLYFEQYNIIKSSVGGALASGIIAGGKGNRFGGLGFQAVYDTRNIIFYPSKGRFVEFTGMSAHLFEQSQPFFAKVQLSMAQYFNVGKRTVLATQLYLGETLGNTPFQQLELIGGNKRMRGYYEGRYRDRRVLSTQAELRCKFWTRLGGVVFAGLGITGSNQKLYDTSVVFPSYGAGLRFCIDLIHQLHLRLDYGRGLQTGFLYFTVGEAF